MVSHRARADVRTRVAAGPAGASPPPAALSPAALSPVVLLQSVLLLSVLLLSVLFLTSCGSTAPSAPTSPVVRAGPGVPAGSVVVGTATGELGDYLVDGPGRTLYLFQDDSAGVSSCDQACATAWPPLTTTTAPTAGAGVTAAELTTITRSDGSRQVAYGGHPLYYFADDTAAGQTGGQGSGGRWWVVGPDGAAITAPATPAGGLPGGGY